MVDELVERGDELLRGVWQYRRRSQSCSCQQLTTLARSARCQLRVMRKRMRASRFDSQAISTGSYAGSNLSATQEHSTMLRAANQSRIAPRSTPLLGLWSRWSRVRAPSLTSFTLLVTMFVGLVKRVGVLRRVQIAVASGRYTLRRRAKSGPCPSPGIGGCGPRGRLPGSLDTAPLSNAAACCRCRAEHAPAVTAPPRCLSP